MQNATDAIKNQITEIDKHIKSNEEMLKQISDPELKSLTELDIQHLEAQKQALEESIESMSYTSSDSQKQSQSSGKTPPTCMVEIRAGTGGDEAGLFAHNLFEMYTKYAENKKWKTILISKNEGGIGNFKEVVFEITSNSKPYAYDLLQNESGVHRVQRIPATESGGRIHTSTATVAVLPLEKNINIQIRPEDLRVDTYRAGGAGGQHVNKTESAIRITHLPTGLVVQCQDERSQHKNRERAMGVLNAKLADLMKKQEKDSIDEIRADQVGTGERSEKIRTYNYPQDRITDHRIKKSWFGINKILSGEADHLFKETKEMIENHTTGDDTDSAESD